MHWLTAHSPTALVQQVAELGLSPRSHGRHLWRHLTRRVTALETDLDQEQVDGITGRARRPVPRAPWRSWLKPARL